MLLDAGNVYTAGFERLEILLCPSCDSEGNISLVRLKVRTVDLAAGQDAQYGCVDRFARRDPYSDSHIFPLW